MNLESVKYENECVKQPLFNGNYQQEIIKLCDLSKSSEPLVSKVVVDEYIKNVQTSFDYEYTGENKFYPFKMNSIIRDLDFSILCIVGASGSGKSTFSKYFGEEENIVWDNSKSIMSNFDSPEDAIDRLGAVGLNSIPTLCKPRNVLSVGEGFRADLARRLKSDCVIDEFTSTVDRNVAFSCCKSVSRYIREKGLKKCVFVSCHKDFIDVLCPDYVIDLDDKCVYDTRGLLRRKFELQIYEKENKREIWNIFKQHHYLSADLNLACRMFVAYYNDDIVAMCAVLPQPGIYNLKYPAWRVTRLVVLPDYQGLGIATKLLEYVCDLYAHQERVVFIRTSHQRLIQYMLRHPEKWQGNGILIHSKEQTGAMYGRKVNLERLSTSFRYIAPCKNEEGKKYDILKFNEDEFKNLVTKEKLF